MSRFISRKRLALIGLFLAFALIAAACGDDDAADPTTAPMAAPATSPPDGGDPPPATDPPDGGDPPPPPVTQPPPPPTMSEGGTLVIANDSAPGFLDPVISNDTSDYTIYRAICEGLYNANQDGVTVRPTLATAMPTVSADGLTWTIPVREDATFNDGTPFNAAASARSINRYLTHPESERAGRIGSVDSAEATGEFEVTLHLSRKDATLIFELAKRNTIAMSPTQLDTLADDNTGTLDFPICVGPFKFEDRTGDDVTVVRSEFYYAPELVHFDEIIIKTVPDSAARLANLRSGDIHAIFAEPSIADDIEADGDLGLERIPSDGSFNLRMNANFANGRVVNDDGNRCVAVTSTDCEMVPPDRPIGHIGVRQAISLSIDRQVMADIVYLGFGLAACSHAGPPNPTKIDCVPEGPDIAAATALVNAAAADMGLTPPLDVTINVAAGAEQEDIGEALQAMVQAAGINLTILPEDQAAVFDRAFAGTYDIILSPWTGRTDLGATYNFFFKCGGAINLTGHCDPAVDALLLEAGALDTLAERSALYQQVHELIIPNYHYVPVIHRETLLGFRATEISGVFIHPNSAIDMAFGFFLP